MEVMGALGDFDVAGILQLLGLRRATGRLVIAADGDDVTLYLTGGRLTLVTSARLPLRLGRVLQQRGLLRPDQLHEALRQQANNPKRPSLGSILLERRWATSAQIRACVEEQCVVVLSRVIAAEQGRFVYTPNIPTPPAVNPTPLDAGRILLEAVRRVDELQQLRIHLPDRNAPLAVSSQLAACNTRLTDLERRIIAALRAGAGSYDELAMLLPVDERTLLRTVITMRSRGLLVAGYASDNDRLAPVETPLPSEGDLSRLLSHVAAAPSPVAAIAQAATCARTAERGPEPTADLPAANQLACLALGEVEQAIGQRPQLVAELNAVDPAARDLYEPVGGPSQGTGDRAGGIGVVTQPDRRHDGILKTTRLPEAPRGRRDRVEHKSARAPRRVIAGRCVENSRSHRRLRDAVDRRADRRVERATGEEVDDRLVDGNRAPGRSGVGMSNARGVE